MKALEPGSRIAFVGLGVMGAAMAGRLIEAGYALRVFNRSPEKAAALQQAGAQHASSLAEALEGADAMISIVGFPSDVREVFFGPDGADGAIELAPSGCLLIDMTTSEPSLAAEINRKAQARGLESLDAPVSGGDVGAKNGALSIMVGGAPEAFARAQALFEVMGKTIVLQGPAGSGQHCKMCNQIAIASNIIGVMEALRYAEESGLEPMRVLDSIGAGAAASWSLSNLYPRVVAGDLGPGFYVEHFLKDIRIARDEAQRMGLRLPGLSLAEALYERLMSEGKARLGTHAIYEVTE